MKKWLYASLFSMLFIGLFTAQASAEKMIQIKGSDTLINLVQRLSEVYMQKNPGTYIAVTGGGSGTGIAALLNGKCDIADASRLMKAKEATRATNLKINPVRVVIALDGVCMIVNQNNPVTGLTLDELGRIFRGEITNWKEVGGEDLKINLYGRQSNSGTYAFVQEVVLAGDYANTMKRMNGNSQIIESIKQDVSGIGYVGVGYAKNAEGAVILKVAAKFDAPYADPLNDEDIKSGAYPLIRPLNQYMNGKPAGNIRDFIAFELSPEGQRIVEEEGFFPIPSDYVKFNKEKAGI